MPPMRISAEVLVATFASIVDHAGRGTLAAGLPRVPATISVIFVHGAQSPMPVRTSRETAALIPHALVDEVEGSGHFVWYERPDAVAAALDRIRA